MSIPRHMGAGDDLVHCLDYVVMLQVMFNMGSGVQCTPLSMWEQLKARGIRSAKNANELVGRNAVYESFARLVATGYIRRRQLPHPTLPGRKGPVVYEVFDNPAWNPDWTPDAAPVTEDHGQVKPQVRSLPGTQEASTTDPAFREASIGAFPQVRTPPQFREAESPPPTPPEGEEDSSSPNPLTGRAGSLPSQREQQRGRAPEFTDAQLLDAAAFLAGMQRWQAGAATAKRCAPRLLRAMRDQGWPLLADLDDAGRGLLETDVLKNTQGAASWAKCLPG
ncbi:hypothetical protein ACWC4D_39825 [Streptomyces sp. NPDC001288]